MLNDFGKAIEALFSKIDKTQAFIIALLGMILFFGYGVFPHVKEYMENSEQRYEARYIKNLELEEKVKSKLDSLQYEKEVIQNELFIMKNDKINDLMSYLELRYPTSTHITIFSVHNGGGVPKTGSKKSRSALYTTDNVRGIDILQEFGEYPLYPGYSAFIWEMLKRKGAPYYLADITKDTHIYEGQTKADMDRLGTKSIYGVWIKSSPTHTYYLTVSFDQIDGISDPSNFPEQTLLTARRELVGLIDISK